jgi:spermidine/putrescine transport system permease protein
VAKTDPKKRNEWFLTLPSLIWLSVLFLLPTLTIFAIAFKPPDQFGGFATGWTLNTIKDLAQPNYPIIILRTIYLSFLTTVSCILLATPAGYCIARLKGKSRQIFLLLVIIPFWTSFLVRIFAWKMLLHPDGTIKKILVFLHIIRPETSLLYNVGAVLLVMVYNFLPFAILPIYAAAAKFDFSLIEAAHDLGARRFQAFMKVFIPGIWQGLVTAILMVFIPALGSYVIPDIVGGPNGEMIGNKIAQRVFTDRNLPHASGLSAFLTIAVLLPMIVMLIMQKRKKSASPIIEEEA